MTDRGRTSPRVPCLTCGRATSRGPYCRTHRRHVKTRYADAAYKTTRDIVLTAWRARHGEWCPGWSVEAHSVVAPNRLSLDHLEVDTRPGEDGPMQVLCLACNSRRAAEGRSAKLRARRERDHLDSSA